ncbi:MAG: DUF2184 domain-containing protein [Spirochaetaceae bacterium]|jgi:hypothetical protein|nr:DUF2184 domain-containing protein [Spirochaetaceae bacterium]
MADSASRRLDRAESAFFARENEFIKTKTYDAKPPALKGLTLVPIAGDVPEGVSEITYRRFNEAGEAKLIADYAKDFPRVDVFGEEYTVKVKDFGDSYGYSIREIRESVRAGKRLDQRRALAARRAHERNMNKITLLSDPVGDTFGVLDFPGITEATLPADGTGGSKSWVNKDVDKILRDINVMLDAVIQPTNGIEVPDTLLLPLSAFTLLTNTRLGDNTISLMKYIRDNFPQITRIDWLNELKGLGAGGTNRIFVGKFDSDHLENQIVNQFEQLEVEHEGGEYTIPCISSTAGVIIYYPMAFAFADGV